MLNQIMCGSLITHAVKYHIDAFAPRKFGGRHKIGIRCNNDDLVNLALESERCNVESKPHVYTFLLCINFEILVRYGK